MTGSTAVRTRFEEGYVDTEGFRIRYLEAGSGAPLVYLHSAGGLRISRVHELLAETYRVVAFEVPGYGREPNDRSQSLDELGATLVSAAHALGLDTFNLWGTSFGAGLALAAAFGAPESIEALVLEGPGAIPPPGGYPEVRSAEELHQYLYAHPERFPVAPQPDQTTLANRRALLQRLAAGPREVTERRLAELDVPTLVVFGTRDRLTPPELGRIYREKMPRCHFVLLFDAGHEAAAERPEAFAALVSDFLDRREAFIVNQRSSLLHP